MNRCIFHMYVICGLHASNQPPPPPGCKERNIQCDAMRHAALASVGYMFQSADLVMSLLTVGGEWSYVHAQDIM